MKKPLPKQAVAPLKFTMFAIRMLEDMAANNRILIVLVMLFLCAALFRMFALEAPNWARYLVSFYILSGVAQFLTKAKPVDKAVLKAMYEDWKRSV